MTSGVKSMALATALALMTIGMGSAVTAAERQSTRGCMGPADCGGGSFRSNDRLRSGGAQDKPYRLRMESKQRGGDTENALKANQSSRSTVRKRRLITNDANDRLGNNGASLVRKRQLKAKDQDRSRLESRTKKKQQAQAGWKYDKKKHKRRKHRSKWFPYYYAGFYYPAQYWLLYHDRQYGFDSSRVSCGEGRDIVRENGYSRVSTVECVGTTYTYLGRRSGETYRITVNARTGNIVNRKRA